MITYVAVFSLAVLISLLSTRCVMRWAMRKGWVDQPDSCRKLHVAPIPRIGGIAIYLSLLLSLVCFYFLPTVVAANFRLQLVSALKLLSLCGMMLLIGLYDDLKTLKPWTKFSAQILVAIVAWFMGFRILSSWSAEGAVLQLGMLSLPITILWIVGLTNAFNLLDGMDGLAGGAALFATISILVPSLQEGQILSPAMLLALAGSIIGFLKYNFNPASIFMGDSGSLLLGSMLSLLALEYSYKSTAAFAIGIPIVALALPVLDTTMVVLRRFLNGKSIFLGDRRHIHHILIERGLKPRNAVILLYGVCGFFGLFALISLNPAGKISWIVVVLLVFFIVFGIHQLHCSEFKELLGYLLRGVRYQRRFLVGNVMAGKMIDGFHNAQSIPSILESLASFLDEMEFSRTEVRVPIPYENCAELSHHNWTAAADGPDHCFYLWSAANKTENGNKEANAIGLEAPGGKGLDTHFRLEFVFKIPRRPGCETLPFEEAPGSNIGRLTFYHPATDHLPVSAVCLLSRQVWKEFGRAIARIASQSTAERTHTQVQQSDRRTPLSRPPFFWVAPIVNRMTGAHSRR
jgi:UDP-GlcNAc:undecaprenyl-phosphate/decaprenyl-phosphate GlcNAc-1-phosphate transferase